MKLWKTTLIFIIVLTIVFAWYLVVSARDYYSGINEVAAGNYDAACVLFEKLEGYRDSEILVEYCRIMAEYDAYSYPSVFRSYHKLGSLQIDNEYLAVEIASSRAEIKALYLHCGQ